jgi:hypothetical protein
MDEDKRACERVLKVWKGFLFNYIYIDVVASWGRIRLFDVTRDEEGREQMQHIIVEVHDHEKAQLLYRVLQSLDFVMRISNDDQDIVPQRHYTETDNTEEFFSYAGLWSGREISATTLRQQAWPRQASGLLEPINVVDAKGHAAQFNG